MSNNQLVLRIHDQEHGTVEGQSKQVRSLSRLAQALGFSVRPQNGVVLAVDSTECFVLPSSQLDLSQFKNAETLSIALEEHLPLDAEEMLIGAVRSKSKESITIVSYRAPLVSEVERLETDQLWIACVSCTALLAAQELSLDSSVPASFDCLWRNRLAGWDLIRIRNGLPIDWQWLAESELLARCDCELRTKELPIVEIPIAKTIPLFVQGTVSEELIGSFRMSRETVFFDAQAEQEEFAGLMATRIVRGSATPWVNFAGRRLPTLEPWAPVRVPLLVLMGILCAALVIFQCVLLWKSSELSASATASDDQQIAAFRKMYPGQKIPADVVGLLRSEYRRLQTSQEEMNKEPPVYSALPVMSKFLNSLPDEAEFRVDHVKAQSNQIVSAEGATRTLGDYKALLSSVREAGFEFMQPSVGNMVDGFTVRLEKLTIKPN